MDRISALILAGGQARRMGGADKAFLPFNGRPLIQHVADGLTAQTRLGAISASGDPARFDFLGVPVLPDPFSDARGPLSGILAGLDWAADAGLDAVISAACDTPVFPADLVARLNHAGGFALAADQSRNHPTFGLWPVTLRAELRAALEAGERRMMRFAAEHGARHVTFPDVAGASPFHNINRPEDLSRV